MKIPFKYLPAAWGLKGKSRLIAEAEYNLSGYDLAVELAKIEHGETSREFTRAVIKIDLQYGRIDQYLAELKLLELDNADNPNATELAKLELDLKHSRIAQQEYDRKRADLLNEPYMAMPKISWDPTDPSKTFFELDYNPAFVEYLQSNGYVGTEDEIISRWLNDVCNSILTEMEPVDTDFVTTVRKIRRDDGKIEHS